MAPRGKSPAAPELARRALARWGADPVLFSREVLGFDPWSRDPDALHTRSGQAEVLANLYRGGMHAVRSGHKCGKSSLAAIAALWFVTCHHGARVIMTAPSAHQVQTIVWKEVKNLYRRAKLPIGGEIFDTAHNGLRFSDGREVFGLSTDEPEKFAGISAPSLLFIVDEASGVDERIYEALFGNSAGGATVLLLSNPTKFSGTFFDAFHTKRNGWHTYHISSLDTPPNRGVACPGLATPEWVAWAKEQWGEDSPFYDVRVRGEFPTQGDNSVIPISLVEAGRDRWVDRAEHSAELGSLVLGVDVARFGDDESVIAPVRGSYCYPERTLVGADTQQLAGAVLSLADVFARRGEAVTANVDVIGVGAGVVDALKHSDRANLTVNGINVSCVSDEPELYPNLRSQLWFNLRAWLRQGGAIPRDERLMSELVAPCYGFDAKGRSVVEPKEKLKQRLKRSPDRADALALGIYSAPLAPSLNSLERYRSKLPRARM